MFSNLKVDFGARRPPRSGGTVGIKLTGQELELLQELSDHENLPKSYIAYCCLKTVLDEWEVKRNASGN